MSKREKSVNTLESPVTEVAAEFPERHVLIKCPGCRRVIDQTKMAENLDVCPRCGRHLRVSGRKRMRITVDAGTFEEFRARWSFPATSRSSRQRARRATRTTP